MVPHAYQLVDVGTLVALRAELVDGGEAHVAQRELELPATDFEERWTGSYIFENEWQSFRTRQNRELELTSVSYTYPKPGRYAIANWKMNLPAEGIPAYLQHLRSPSGARVVIAPPFPYLKELAGRATLAGQNCADQKSGPLTGEVSPTMLRDCGAAFVILGHSERRSLFGEDDAMIARKLAVAIEAGLTPILCVGEDQKIRDAGEAATFVANQIKLSAVPALAAAPEVIIAYEPVWAIGTGRNATGGMVAEMVADIRESLDRFWPSRHTSASPILYGGSVTPDNIGDLAQNGSIDGFLVGGASLDCLKFSVICDCTGRLSEA